jgi:Tfp pilus assembly protein PilV
MPRKGESMSGRLDPRDQSGIALIETLVAAILLVIVAVGVFGAFDAATRSTAEERHRARAHALAQSDLSRMRTMRISDLSNLNQTRTVSQDGQVYTIHSLAEYQTDTTGTQSCEAGTASADYIKISSSVTWSSIGTRPPVVASTLVAPPNGSISADSGSLAVQVVDSQDIGVAGIGLAGSGAGSFSGSTGANGCAIFGNLPEGDYTLTLSGFAAGLVDKDGSPPGSITTSVVAESTNTVVLQYDSPGEIVTSFTTPSYTGTVVPSTADSLITFNTGMTSSRVFPPTPGARVSSITASSMFPFSSDYALYAGTCGGDNPNPLDLDPPPAPLAIASVLLPPGGSEVATVQLPALHITVYQGSDTTSARASGATIKVRDTLCSNFLRTFTANTQGQLDDPGLPFTDYSVCADGLVSGNNRRRTQNVSMNDPPDVTGGQTVDVFLTGGTSQSGTCP